MLISGKKQVSGDHAAALFLMAIQSQVFITWPALCDAIAKQCGRGERPGTEPLRDIKESTAAAYEFYLAILAISTHSLNDVSDGALVAAIDRAFLESFQFLPPQFLMENLLPSDYYLDDVGFVANDRKQAKAPMPRIQKIYLSYSNGMKSHLGIPSSATHIVSRPACLYLVRLGLTSPPVPSTTRVVDAAMTFVKNVACDKWWRDFLRKHEIRYS